MSIFFHKNENLLYDNVYADYDDDDGRIQIESESFYLLSFTSWLHNFADAFYWEHRAGNRGFFALVAVILLAAQTIILFDLAYGRLLPFDTILA